MAEERMWTEKIEIAGSALVGRVKELIQEGNATRLIIRGPNDAFHIEISLVLTAFVPLLAALGAMAALLNQGTVEIVRTEKK